MNKRWDEGPGPGDTELERKPRSLWPFAVTLLPVAACVAVALSPLSDSVLRGAIVVLGLAAAAVLGYGQAERVALRNKHRHSERRFRILVDQAPDAFFLHDANGRFRDVNPQACRSLGYSRDQLLSMSIADVEIESNLALAREEWARVEPGSTMTLLGRHKRRDGTTFPIEARVSCCMLGGEKLFLAVIRDITADLAARREKSERDSLLARACRLAKVGGWSFNTETQVGSWTEEVARLHDLDDVDPIAVPDVMQYYTGENLPLLVAAIKRIGETGEPYDLEVDLITAKGRRRRMHTVGEAVRENGRIVRVQGVCQDITERWEAEQRIRDLAGRISLATKAARIGIWDVDLGTGATVYSEEVYRLYGLPPGAEMTKEADWLAPVHPDDRRRVVRERADALASGEGYSTEYRIVTEGGEVRSLKSEAMVFRDNHGLATRLLGCVIDVTPYRQAMEERELARVRAEEANAAKSRFLAVMSHELRTPLNAIIGFSELLLMGELMPRQRDSIAIVAEAGKKLLQVIQDILDLNKIEAGRIRVQNAAFDLRAELDGVIAQFAPEAASKSLTLTCDVAPDVPGQVVGDADLLRLVLVNLLGNAVKFTLEGSVELRVERAPEEVERGALGLTFHVRDTGVGIRPENQARIFNMFEQEEDNMTRRFGGTGIGLTISRELVSLMQGRIWLESEPGKGAHFSFSAGFEAVDAAVEPRTESLPPSAEEAESQSGNVLVVEDDVFSRTLMVRLLEQNGYRAKATGDGNGALDWLQREAFDAVLMDIQLPSMSGLEVTRRIRAGEVPGCRTDLPIIAVSAYASPADRAAYTAEGMSGFVAKPVDLLTVLATLRRFLDPPSPAGGLAGERVGSHDLMNLTGPRATRRLGKLAAPDR
jgi:two-component system, sensor histidine kinase and response regulator